MLATDGLLEDDGQDPDGNLRALFGVLEDGAGDEVEALADRLLASPRRPTRHGDDIAVMVARVDGAGRPRLHAIPGLYGPPPALRAAPGLSPRPPRLSAAALSACPATLSACPATLSACPATLSAPSAAAPPQSPSPLSRRFRPIE